MKAQDTIQINIFGLHRNSQQWQRPNEFLPDRFDPTHPLAKTPTGQKRHTGSFLPFSGGKRICFGKTFAESVLRMTASLMAQRFDFEFVDKATYNKDSLPQIVINQSHFPELKVKLTKRHL